MNSRRCTCTFITHRKRGLSLSLSTTNKKKKETGTKCAKQMRQTRQCYRKQTVYTIAVIFGVYNMERKKERERQFFTKRSA